MSDNPQTEPAYIPVEEAAAMLGVTTRQVSRLQARIRTERAGNRILYNKQDVLALARERGREVEARSAAEVYRKQYPPQMAMLNIDQVLEYLREKDAVIERQQQQLLQLARRVGELEGQLKYSPRRHKWWQRVSPPPAPSRDEPPSQD